MGFSSIFKNIWTVTQKMEPVVKNIALAVDPASAPLFTMIDPLFHNSMNTVVAGEINNSSAASGASKLADSVSAFANQDYINQMQEIAKQGGMKLVWDDVSLKAGLSAQADVYNYFAKVKASMKFVPFVTPGA